MPEEDDKLEKMPSVAFYDKLDSEFVPCTYCKFCDDNSKEFIGQPNWAINLCYMVARNLEIISHMVDGKSDKKDKFCDSLKSWIDDKILDKEGYNDRSKYLTIITKLHTAWNEIINNSSGIEKDKICESAYAAPEFEKRKRRKLMDDYCENYPFISQQLEKSNADCKPYRQYLIESSSVFTEIENGCRNIGIDPYCPKLNKNCINNSPNNLLSMKPCKLLGDSPSYALSQSKDERVTCGTHSESGSIPTTGSSSSLDFSDHRVVILVGISIWGIFLTLLFVYKLTPFGSRLRNLLSKKLLNKDKIDENEFEDLVYDDSHTVDLNLESRGYHLTYKPA
ncbi:PIR Superfamily Protein [Plasmodium ovale wallikeri]|uniref:PIR Superfamily Protein n=1 Tax=Plasmodium ovale wallikeri TaxID=864142 RepID=A0A1A9AQY5_PLAOA|nr:PIR Superfamily Protein [Plasmodium ovale wallikeri]